MSNQLTIQTGQSAIGSTGPVPSNTPAPAPAAPAAKPVPLFVNPSFQFDPTVGLVVLEFHDNTGAVSNSIPSQRQLEAYRTGQETPPTGQPTPTPQAVDGKTAAG